MAQSYAVYFSVDEDEDHELRSDDAGLCLNCHAWTYGVEPDARGCECEECGRGQVFGIEESLLDGPIRIKVPHLVKHQPR